MHNFGNSSESVYLQFFAIGYKECDNRLDTKRPGQHILEKVTGRKLHPTRQSS